MLQDSQWAVTVVTADELPVFKNNHGCSETKKFLFSYLGTNPMTKIRLIPLMPEFLLTMCLSVNLSRRKQCWNLYRPVESPAPLAYQVSSYWSYFSYYGWWYCWELHCLHGLWCFKIILLILKYFQKFNTSPKFFVAKIQKSPSPNLLRDLLKC